MSANLLENFALLAASEGGVAKLRELILSLAVRGQLVPQDPADEPATELLERIRAEKERLVAAGRIKREKALLAIGEEEKPFELPEGWEWVRFGEIGTIGSSSRVHQRDWTTKGVPFYRAREIAQLSRSGFVNNDLFITEELYSELSLNGLIPEKNDIMITGVGTIGVPFVVRDTDRFYFKDASVLIFKNHFSLNPAYLYLFMNAPYWIDLIHAESMGTTVHTLTIGRASEVPVPLPPLPEQSRIVAKVEALMALCDRLEAQQGEAARVQAHWTQAALDQLAESGDADEFTRNWQALADHFDTLFATPASIDVLDATLLQLAVRGKLVTQNPADEPASELLKKIRADKDRLIAEGKIKRDKPLPPIADDEKPFELPDGWELVRLAECTTKITDGEHSTPERATSGNYLLSARNVTNEGILLYDVDYVPDHEFQRIRKRCDPNIGDVLISCSGSVGRVAIVDRDNSYSMVRSAAMVRPSGVTPDFLAAALRSPYLQAQMVAKSRQSAQANLFLGAISSLVITLPPLSEQSRIVAKLDELLALTRTLRARLTESCAAQTRLASVLVDEVAA